MTLILLKLTGIEWYIFSPVNMDFTGVGKAGTRETRQRLTLSLCDTLTGSRSYAARRKE